MRFPLFDGMRAVAALMVFVDHAWFRWHPNRCGFVACPPSGGIVHRAWETVAPSLGPTGVSVFFVISGFLIYRPFVVARESSRGVDHRAYALRRAGRILPAWWLVLGFVLLFGAETRSLSPGRFLEALTLTGIYSYEGLLYSPVPPVWSVCVELSFYLFVPIWSVLVLGLNRGRGSRTAKELVALGALAGLGILWRLYAVNHPPDGTGFQELLGFVPVTEKILMGGFDLFAAGMALAVLGVIGRLGLLASIRPWAAWLAAGVLFGASAWLAAVDGPFSSDAGMRGLVGGIGRLSVAFLLVLPAATRLSLGSVGSSEPVTALLRARPIVWLGIVSYGIYLWHAPVLAWIYRVTRDHGIGTGWWLPWALIGFGLTAAVASLSWKLLEERVNRWAHRFRSTRPAET